MIHNFRIAVWLNRYNKVLLHKFTFKSSSVVVGCNVICKSMEILS